MNIDYVGKTSLSQFLKNITSRFAPLNHSHAKSDITDFPTIPAKTSELENDSGFLTNITVDSSLSSSSTNPVENKVITNAISEARSYTDTKVADMIPAITDDDNGKFLRVVDGEAKWQMVQNAEEVAF